MGKNQKNLFENYYLQDRERISEKIGILPEYTDTIKIAEDNYHIYVKVPAEAVYLERVIVRFDNYEKIKNKIERFYIIDRTASWDFFKNLVEYLPDDRLMCFRKGFINRRGDYEAEWEWDSDGFNGLADMVMNYKLRAINLRGNEYDLSIFNSCGLVGEVTFIYRLKK